MNSLFGDWKWKNPFATIQRPNPQDFITPSVVTREGVSVNPHEGLGVGTGITSRFPYNMSPETDWGYEYGNDAPTYQQKTPSTFDADAYTGAMADYDYDSEIQAEKQKQLELLMQLGMGSPPPKASPLPPQSFGRSGNVKFSLLNPTSTVEQDAILSAPFLQKWRTMYGG